MSATIETQGSATMSVMELIRHMGFDQPKERGGELPKPSCMKDRCYDWRTPHLKSGKLHKLPNNRYLVFEVEALSGMKVNP